MHIERLTLQKLPQLDVNKFHKLLSVLSDTITKPIGPALERAVQTENLYLYVGYETSLMDPCASLTVLVEPKIIHDGRPVAHIEDVVVLPSCQGRGFGKQMVERALQLARETDCYKVVLHCSPDKASFYQKLGFYGSTRGLRIDL